MAPHGNNSFAGCSSILKGDGSSVSDDDVHSLYTEANRFALVSSL